MSASSGGSKASFVALDGGAGTFNVQYNPKEFKVTKSVSWKPHDDQGQDASGMEFQKGEPQAVSMDLYFDTTNEGGDVRTKWVNGLLRLTNAEVNPGEGSSDKKRPPQVKFIWGTFDLVCVVEKVDVTYLMFSSDGTPVRARVSLALKEWEPKDFDSAKGGASITSEAVTLVTAGSGESASSIAAKHGTDWRQVADDNNLDNPEEVPSGTTVVVRK